MKRITLISLFLSVMIFAQAEYFRFAQLTDIHISPSNPSPLEDLRRSVDDLLQDPHLAFVIATGDLTEAGDRRCLELVKAELDRLHVPYYVTSGNHETTWSESGCTAFEKVFGSSRFAFSYDQCFFVGFNSGPFLKMMDGHVAPQDISWLEQKLDSVSRRSPDKKIIACTHYPLQTGDVDNWFDVTDMLRRYNVQCLIGGHYHRNLLYSADGIPDVLGRSNLRAKDSIGGYTIVSVGPDSIRWAEKRIGQEPVQWLSLPFGKVEYPAEGELERPSMAVNDDCPEVQELWRKEIGVAVLEAPAVGKKAVFFGDDRGTFHALDRKTGRTLWIYQTGSRIKCAPLVFDGRVVFGSTDGNIYCLNEKTGKLLWKFGTADVVMGCPAVGALPNGETVVLIGSSDHRFRAISLKTGNLAWSFNDVNGYCVSRPCVYGNKVYFGAWDCYLYALNMADGSLAWKWSNGRTNDKFSPAAVWPVASDGKIFIVAPDRVMTCLTADSGKVVYRTAEHKVRESIGISADGNTVYSRCMEDTVIAMDARSAEPVTLWKTDAAYGYDHNPSMMIEAGKVVVFGTKNGLLHAVAGSKMKFHGRKLLPGDVVWRHKVGNSVINTVVAPSEKEIYLTTTSGIITRVAVK